MDSSTKETPGSRGFVKTVSQTLDPVPAERARAYLKSSATSVYTAKESSKPLVAATFVGILFLTICICVIVTKPCVATRNCSEDDNSSLVKISPRVFRPTIDTSFAAFRSENGSRPYGRAGGVTHFIYGELPSLNPYSLTEPNSKQARYLSYKCGESENVLLKRDVIHTGTYVERNANLTVPWLVRIVVLENFTANDGYSREVMIGICGGVAISRDWILTARHCFERNVIDKTYIAHKYHGKLKLIRHERLYGYPKYDDTYNQHDIMLVRLKNPLIFTSPMLPICLPNFDVIPRTSRICVLVGGTGGDVEASMNVELWVELEDPTECQSRYCGLKYDVNNNICDKTTSSKKNPLDKGKCHGLSGYPLICQEHGRWVAYGILNWSGPNCDVTMGRGYALISTRMRWICGHLKSPSWPPCRHK